MRSSKAPLPQSGLESRPAGKPSTADVPAFKAALGNPVVAQKLPLPLPAETPAAPSASALSPEAKAAAFADLQLLRVSIGIPVTNAPSHRVAAKLGAVREGVMRQELVLPSGPSDVVLYSLLPGELRQA